MEMSCTGANLEVEVECSDPPVIRLCGEAGFHNREQISDAVRSLISEGYNTVLADLNKLEYIDSSALSTLVKCASEMRIAGGSMELTGASRHVARVLTQSGAALFFGTGISAASPEDDHGRATCCDNLWMVSEFTLPASQEATYVARKRVTDLVNALPLRFPDGADIMIAFGEAVANAVRHGCRCDANQRISVRFIADPQRVKIDVCDPGPGFCPSQIPAPTTRSIVDGGMGIYMMRELMDEVEFLFDAGTTVRLVKHMPAAGGA